MVSGLASNDRHAQVAQNAPVTAAPAGAETARHAASQIATAITNQAGKATEIALNPEELGRVRLSITATDGAITLNVFAERPETNDLLRRHIDVLAQEFRSLGYDTISFSFGDGGQSDANAEAATSDETSVIENNEKADPEANASALPTSGLDLRL
jgi:flagellar hook-length control protein FliK